MAVMVPFFSPVSRVETIKNHRVDVINGNVDGKSLYATSCIGLVSLESNLHIVAFGLG